MRVGRGGRSVGMTRLGYVARVTASEIATATANGNGQALTYFLQNFAANLTPPATAPYARPGAGGPPGGMGQLPPGHQAKPGRPR